MPHPASNPSRPSPPAPTCPRCGNRLPIRGDRIGPCPLCRDATSPGNRSTQTNIDILTAPDSPIHGVGRKSRTGTGVIVVAIVLLSIIGVLVYFLA